MQEEIIKSVGIDIGTTTTQLIFSEMLMKDTAGFGCVPQTQIVKKNVLYRSQIYFTPLCGQGMIDAEKIYEIVEQEFEKASIRPRDLDSGAIIITGESERKQNARQVVEVLSKMAGDFVVATAGPDLEGILAGKGAGAAELSKKTGKIVANLDVGGGTTNICFFKDGEVYDTACLDIGGRLVKVRDGNVVYLSEKVKKFAAEKSIPLREGEPVLKDAVQKLTREFADILAQAVGLMEKTPQLEFFKTNRLLSVLEIPEMITFSGGVAECMQTKYPLYTFGDIGVFLANAILENPYFAKAHVECAMETVRATVIGAGNESLHISGSTISYTETKFPLKNLPIGKIKLTEEADIDSIVHEIERVSCWLTENGQEQVALAMEGIRSPSFLQIEKISQNIMMGYERFFPPHIKVILIIKEDIGKALGQALQRVNSQERVICCIDHVGCESGDYIDIGHPIANGSVIPVVVKTMVFGEEL